ncbi:hypothetical protein OS493_039135 [Desmophyllum pertusum]|uniref:Uncharacterized protein n=1 Tax=Desmophyllum pertusum TaxID=174260 RepID=A0A9W9Y714_9CNID|nr:hypothetical protein OS493_039135 [Desmophyllum pertusum]
MTMRPDVPHMHDVKRPKLRHFCCFADKPKLQQGSRRYTEPDNEVAQSNPGFILEQRRSSQEEVHSSEKKEPVYCEIPAEIWPATYENPDVGHYQSLNNANERLKSLYAGLNSHSNPCYVNTNM